MLFTDDENAGNGRVSVWRCIGCGRIEGPQPCIGVCQDRKVQLVGAGVHDAVVAQLARLRQQTQVLAEVVRQLAHTMPREGEWKRSYCALQERARQALARLGTQDIGLGA